METPLISIIIPVYNVEKYIKACLTSVFNQSYTNIEIIIIDDNGKDKSIEIASEMLKITSFRYSIIKQIENMGVSEARNTGIKHSLGKYIFFLDADDVITPNCIELLYNAMVSSKSDLVMGEYKRIYSKEFNKELDDNINYKDSKKIEYKDIYYNNESHYIWNILYKKSVILDNNLFFEKDIKFAEDALWITLVQFKAKKMVKINAQTYKYRITKDSSCISLCAKDKYINNLILVIEKLFDYVNSQKYSNLEKGVLISRIRTYKNGLYSSAVLYNMGKKDIDYKRLKTVKLNIKEVKTATMSNKKKLIELVLSTLPILDSYYFYKLIFKIKKLLGR